MPNSRTLRQPQLLHSSADQRRRGLQSLPVASLPYPAVPPEEIAFALTLFHSVGERQSSFATAPPPQLTPPERRSLQRLAALLHHLDAGPAAMPNSSHGASGSTLAHTLLALWTQYRGDTRQTSICARVLNFYFLAQRGGGTLLAPWMIADQACPDQACPDQTAADTVSLAPALIEALAEVELDSQGTLPALRYIERVRACAPDAL